MKIIFSRHAKFRCVQRSIPEQWVIDLLQNIPLLTGKHHRLMERTNLIVIYEDTDNERMVVTLFAARQFNKEQNKVNLYNQARNLLDKEKYKHYRRHKKSRVHKFKKR